MVRTEREHLTWKKSKDILWSMNSGRMCSIIYNKNIVSELCVWFVEFFKYFIAGLLNKLTKYVWVSVVISYERVHNTSFWNAKIRLKRPTFVRVFILELGICLDQRLKQHRLETKAHSSPKINWLVQLSLSDSINKDRGTKNIQ